jgi:hypothetical protein
MERVPSKAQRGVTMRVAAVCALPFHRWILQDLCAELEALGHDVHWLVHWPTRFGDWLELNVDGPVFRGLEALHPDVVLAAEYPYPMLHTVADAPVVATRHSLAARGNTWESSQGGSDFMLTWSDYDEQRFASHHVEVNPLRSGCVWAERMYYTPRKAHEKRTIGWAPTWNKEFQCADVVVAQLRELHANGWDVIVRSHGGVAGDDHGFTRDDPMNGPWDFLHSIDVLVADVTGLSLLALCTSLPVVNIDAVTEDTQKRDCRLAQFDPTGPEWQFRNALGSRVPRGYGLVRAVEEATVDQEARDQARNILLGGGAEWTGSACQRAATLIETAILR